MRSRAAQAGRDRAYLRRLGEYIDEANRDELREHLARPLPARLARSFALAERYRGYSNRDPEDDDPAAFYAKARARGLIKV